MDAESSHQVNAGNGSVQSQHHSSGRSRRGPDFFLITCRVFAVITALSAIFCIAFNVISAIQSFRNGTDIFDGIFRCYAVIVGIIVVIAETEWQYFLSFSKVLQYWVGRGMLQIFVAVMTRAYPEHLRNHQELFLLQSIAAYLLLGCGAIYVIAGIFCLGMLKRRHQKTHISRDQAIKDLENLQRQREELEARLLDDQA
ncbi:hypothetical protein F511_12994 [Dorcoceras hygrometricum]|uniref:Golgi apparatus membrane protein TVP15 n=1 Tax=Dorcoceras hygrometricum TaxID=472368 RepID=A0A2Z7BWY7_9LAMI|nr:hypothetical protein F511_12994 [Dorcoceras hygrometricum]